VSRKFTTEQVATRTGLPQKEVLRRIRLGHIKAEKFGWIWIVDEKEVRNIKRYDWYKRTQVA
jgi:hypothetical protein